MKAVGYIRVSTEDQAKEGVSLENQEAKIKAYCELKDLDLLEIIEDAGHFAPLEQPDTVARLLIEFLNQTQEWPQP